MEPLKLLSLGAIALAISACILVYILHRQTSARLDALTQANLGITHTLHRLIASSMPLSQQASTSNNGVNDTVSYTHDENNDMTAERIVVSDDSEDDVSEDDDSKWTDDENGDDTGNESDDIIELGSAPSSLNEPVHNIVIDAVLFTNETQDAPTVSERFEELNNTDVDDDSDGDDEHEDDDSDDSSSNISEDEKLDVVKLNGDDAPVEAEEIDESSNEEINMVAFLLPSSNPETNDIDIGIIPFSSKNQTTNMMPSSDNLKQMKVEELRKLAITKLALSEEYVKKLKKQQLVQKLSEAFA